MLESGVVAVDGSFGAADLFYETAALFLEGGSVSVALCGRSLDRFLDDVAVAVERGELGDDSGLELVARDPFAITAFRAELLAAGAGVVVVGATVAFGAHADVGALATSAAQQTGEQVVAGVAAAQCHVPAALAQQPLRTREGHLVDERFVQTGKALAAPDDAAEVGLVLEHPLHDRRLPAGGRCRCMLLAENARDRGRAELVACIELEDALHRRGGAFVGHDLLLVVPAVAEREAAGRPLAFLGAAFDSGRDPVDDRRVLELGEHGQHLQHHPPRRGAGVERLRRRLQHDVERVEFFGQLSELLHLPRQAVDAVDEQHVDRTSPGKVERRLQAGAVELGSRRLVLLVRDDPPALLRLAERFQPFPLRVQRGRLVLFVGRDAGVDADPG